MWVIEILFKVMSKVFGLLPKFMYHQYLLQVGTYLRLGFQVGDMNTEQEVYTIVKVISDKEVYLEFIPRV